MIKNLYAITDPGLIPPERFTEKIEACLIGGCRLIQFRDKSDNPKKVHQAQLLRRLCDRYQAHLIINDDLELALAIKADGVHLGQEDLAIATARNRIEPDFCVGATCHNSLELAQQATASGATYLAFGRFFPSATKPHARAAALDILSQARQQFGLPIVAIGGINRSNAAKVIEYGADAVAVCHDIFAPDTPAEIEQRTRQITQLFE